MAALTGDLSIIASTGAELHATTDIGLAWQWAEAEVDARPDMTWSELSYNEQCHHVSEALTELRRAYRAAR